MPEFVVSPGSRVAVVTPGENDSVQHPVYEEGVKVTLTKEQAEPLLASGSVAESEAATQPGDGGDGDKGKK